LVVRGASVYQHQRVPLTSFFFLALSSWFQSAFELTGLFDVRLRPKPDANAAHHFESRSSNTLAIYPRLKRLT
jgi:hypothetical protein